MSKKVFVDSDIILDLLCRKQPFYDFAAELFTMGDTGNLKIFTTSLVFANVFYILRKVLGAEKAKELLRKLKLIVNIIPIGEKVVDLSLNSKFRDLEDGLQYYTAIENNINVLLTRNVKDYLERDIVVETPQEYLGYVK